MGSESLSREEGEKVLVDFIIGKEASGQPGYRFVRVPDQNRVYASKIDVELSTRFEDWIDTDLLQTNRYRFEKVVIDDYSIDERTRRVSKGDRIVLTSRDGEWLANKMSSNQVMDTTKLENLMNTLDSLSIVGVRPKPAGLSASLVRAGKGESISQADAMSLQSKGYFFNRDGQLLSNEGELQLYTKDGTMLVLRFGEVVYGRGDAVSAGTQVAGNSKGPAENRYLFVSAEFDPSLLPEPSRPKDTLFTTKSDSLLTEGDKENKELHRKHQLWRTNVENGRIKAVELNQRFAQWYYVISAESYERLHLERSDLVIRE